MAYGTEAGPILFPIQKQYLYRVSPKLPRVSAYVTHRTLPVNRVDTSLPMLSRCTNLAYGDTVASPTSAVGLRLTGEGGAGGGGVEGRGRAAVGERGQSIPAWSPPSLPSLPPSLLLPFFPLLPPSLRPTLHPPISR